MLCRHCEAVRKGRGVAGIFFKVVMKRLEIMKKVLERKINTKEKTKEERKQGNENYVSLYLCRTAPWPCKN